MLKAYNRNVGDKLQRYTRLEDYKHNVAGKLRRYIRLEDQNRKVGAHRFLQIFLLKH